MISHISGSVLFSGDKFIIVDVGGVGYKLFVTPDVLHKSSKVDVTISLWTHLAVREDSLDLYGFTEKAEVEFFEMLIGISGVGPKTALGIMGVAPLDTLKTAIASGDTGYMTKVSGIGRKNADKIILELRDKLGSIDSKAASGLLREESDALDALTSLGYSQREARDALKEISSEVTGTSDRIREALKKLGNGGS